MAPGLIVLVILGLCTLVGLYGRHRRMGFLGFFVLSLLITPVFALLVAYLTQEAPTPTGPQEP